MNHMVCPYCGDATVTKRGKTIKGKQRFKCRECNKSFLETTKIKAVKELKNKKVVPNGVLCVECNSENVRLNGFTRAGTQRYLCRDCKKVFFMKVNKP
ncbi:hypothetical protein FACS189490_04750 [Clostridia bacterium]|nr:hypothetical protein FACS189490_04750 [Clostridia bacterium]